MEHRGLTMPTGSPGGRLCMGLGETKDKKPTQKIITVQDCDLCSFCSAGAQSLRALIFYLPGVGHGARGSAEGVQGEGCM